MKKRQRTNHGSLIGINPLRIRAQPITNAWRGNRLDIPKNRSWKDSTYRGNGHRYVTRNRGGRPAARARPGIEATEVKRFVHGHIPQYASVVLDASEHIANGRSETFHSVTAIGSRRQGPQLDAEGNRKRTL